ncbi:MAG: DUF4831 family protein, partial [Bacteroides cellulosilyticus]
KENVYFVKMKDKTVAPLIELSKDGIVYSINMPLGSGQRKTTPTIQPKVTGNTPNVNPRDFLTEEILMSNSTAKMAELVAKRNPTVSVKVRMPCYAVKQNNMPKDGAQLKLMLDNLTLQERAMTEMFAGKVTTEEKIYHHSHRPQRDEA